MTISRTEMEFRARILAGTLDKLIEEYTSYDGGMKEYYEGKKDAFESCARWIRESFLE